MREGTFLFEGIGIRLAVQKEPCSRDKHLLSCSLGSDSRPVLDQLDACGAFTSGSVVTVSNPGIGCSKVKTNDNSG